MDSEIQDLYVLASHHLVPRLCRPPTAGVGGQNDCYGLSHCHVWDLALIWKQNCWFQRSVGNSLCSVVRSGVHSLTVFLLLL